MMAVTEDDIIKRKLLIEGDGGNDDRRINSLLKTFVKWCQSSESVEDSYMTYQKMLAVLAQCELTMVKSVQVHRMNVREQENYTKLNSEIELQLQEAHDKIAECKMELNAAKCVRRNRQEYDALAKVIQQHPDRQDTLRQLEDVDKELEVHRDTERKLNDKLDLRRKQFHVLVTAIHELQRILEDDEQQEGQVSDGMKLDS